MAMRVMRGTVMRVVGGDAQRAFVHVGLAQDHCARGAKARHHVSVVGRRFAAPPHARARGKTGDVEVVLDRYRHTVQAAHDAIAPASVGRHGLFLDQCVGGLQIGVERGIEALDRILVACRQLQRLKSPDGQPMQQLDQRSAADVTVVNRWQCAHEHSFDGPIMNNPG